MKTPRLTACVLSLALVGVSACSGEPDAAQITDWAEPTINTTSASAAVSFQGADGRGRLELSNEGCLFLAAPSGDQDLVWPSDWSIEQTHAGWAVRNRAGARLDIGQKVSLLGPVQTDAGALTCQVAESGSAIYVVDFLGKTLPGG